MKSKSWCTLFSLAAVLLFGGCTPTATITPTRTHSPSITLASTITILPNSTTKPTSTETPTSTPPEWVTSFAQPILETIAGQSPKYADDFTKTASEWFQGGTDPSCKVHGSELDLATGELKFHDCDFTRIGLDFPDYVLEFEVRFLEDSPEGSYWFMDYRNTSCTDCSISFRLNGEISIGGGGVEKTFSDLDIDATQFNRFLMIAYREKFAFFLNDQPLYYLEYPGARWGGVDFRVTWDAETHEIMAGVAIDNFKIWDIYDLVLP